MEPQQPQPPPHSSNPPPVTDPPPPQPQSSTAPPPPTSTTNLPSPSISTTPNPAQNPNPTPNPNPRPIPPPQSHLQSPQPTNAQPRPARAQWPQHQPSAPAPQPQRGGMAIGVPAAPQSSPYSPSFGQHQFGGLGRGAVSTSESGAGPSAPQVLPPGPGYQTTVSSGIGSAGQIRPSGISAPQLRPVRSITNPNSHQPTSNLTGHGLVRGSSVGSPGLTSPSGLHGPQLRGQPQPWLAASPGKPPLPSHQFRGQMDPPSIQQRALVQQQSVPGPPHQLQASSSLSTEQSFFPHQQQDQYRQTQSARAGSSLSPQPQVARGILQQRPSSIGTVQPYQPGAHTSTTTADANESSNSILSKRSIHELVNQVDPSEKLDSEVVDVLVDLAEEFVDSITTFGCSLTKHRKSNTLEAKDILLHLERNWNLTIPGFGGDEIKSYKKPAINDVHRERLAAVKRSMGAEAASARNMPGQQVPKGVVRAPPSAMDSQP